MAKLTLKQQIAQLELEKQLLATQNAGLRMMLEVVLDTTPDRANLHSAIRKMLNETK
ncbi:hypothetical protein [Aliagarivorans taiwanensis]|uniref:hypothetical protein n=1 Tax=Aliagarivorans taiwanensis TaxID=561966 RepID=UPI00041328D3|nr:hypothetical protein [Aliagarivorans taiwanensis]